MSVKWTSQTSSQFYKGHLLLVNRRHPLPANYQTTGLEAWPHAQDAHVQQQAAILLEKQCMQHLEDLIMASDAAGEIVLVSGYRSAEEQQSIYEESLRVNGADFTSRFVALPFASEHQTGLAVDVGLRNPRVDLLCPSFPDAGACLRFKQNAARFGFIQRYKADKTTITGIDCEPWHFRYVGDPHALIMEERNLCLEEYIALLGQHPPTAPLLYGKEGTDVLIYSISAHEADRLQALYKNNSTYEISGNNCSGFIITEFLGRCEA